MPRGNPGEIEDSNKRSSIRLADGSQLLIEGILHGNGFASRIENECQIPERLMGRKWKNLDAQKDASDLVAPVLGVLRPLSSLPTHERSHE